MRIFSGIQPSGAVHIGNYLGAMKNWAKVQEGNEAIYCVVDYHAITVDYPKEEMSSRIINSAKDIIASGVDPEKSTIFLQSDIKEHTELAWLLNCIVNVGELSRMTQFKEKAIKIRNNTLAYMNMSPKLLEQINKLDPNKSYTREEVLNYFNEESMAKSLMADLEESSQKNISAGLFSYPVLMAADILIYKAEGVPVGEDQVQHVELTRDLARKFNSKFGETFPEPKPLLTEAKRIMSLTGEGKMSKSSSPNTYIALTDDADTIRKKIASATTDDGKAEDISPATINLIGLMGEFAGKEAADEYMAQRKAGTIKYSEFKPALAEAIIKELEPFQKRRSEISDDDVKRILEQGAAKLRPIAQSTIEEVKTKMGLKI